MNINEYLLTVLGEEAGEIVQSMSKIKRFGPDSISPEGDKNKTNRDQLIHEINDLVAVTEMLEENGALGAGFFEDYLDRALINAKKRKVEKYMKVSQNLGLLEKDA